MHILSVRGLSKHFGGIRAVEDVTFSVQENAIVSIIGPNGAGKTTLFNCLTGVTRPTGGTILFPDRDISRWTAHEIAGAGIARTFQNIRLFSEMTALENVMVAQHTRMTYGITDAVFHLRRYKSAERIIREKALEYLQFVGLEQSASVTARNLPYGSQRKLEIARALATEPKVLLLDEPTAGMNPMETTEVMGLIRRIKELGMTIILIEHDMRLVMGISEWIIALDHGVRIAEGSPETVRNDPLVIEAYLGKEGVF